MLRTVATAIPIAACAACDPGDVRLAAPDTRADSTIVAIQAAVDTPHAAIAESLGWAGGVPDAQIRLHRMDDPYGEAYWIRVRSDSSGVAKVANIINGLYEIEASRPLTEAESTLAHGVRILAGGRRAYLPTPRVDTVSVIPDRQGSLVFSEFGLTTPLPWETGGTDYVDAKYFEVHNNGDTTIFLDGKYWGIGYHFTRDYPAWPCAQTVGVRNDPDGVWTRFVFRFPGRGTDHPLGPGETALIAKAALDHRPVHPGLYDLRGADFEWGGLADNPDVPNLEQIGLESMPPFWPLPGGEPQFLSEPVDLQTLPRHVDPYSGWVWVRIPKAAVLDAWSAPDDVSTWHFDAAPACLEDLHEGFERLPGPGVDYQGDFAAGLSHQRRVVALRDGRKVLQDANTSMVDFVKAPRTPGWIP
jgi:hypothetical protein